MVFFADLAYRIGDAPVDGGWYGPKLTNRGAQLAADVQRDFPFLLRSGSLGTVVTINCELAQALLRLPKHNLPHTFRRRQGPPKLTCNHPTQIGCSDANCHHHAHVLLKQIFYEAARLVRCQRSRRVVIPLQRVPRFRETPRRQFQCFGQIYELPFRDWNIAARAVHFGPATLARVTQHLMNPDGFNPGIRHNLVDGRRLDSDGATVGQVDGGRNVLHRLLAGLFLPVAMPIYRRPRAVL